MNATEDGQPMGEYMDTPEAIERAYGISMLSERDKATAIAQLGPTVADRADNLLARLKRDAAADPYRPADRLLLTLPAAIEIVELVRDLIAERRDA